MRNAILLTLIGSGENLTEQNVRYCIRMVGEDSHTLFSNGLIFLRPAIKHI